MGKYTEIEDYMEIDLLPNGFYKNKWFNIFNYNGLTLFIGRDEHKMLWYYKDFSEGTYTSNNLTKEEFRTELALRKTSIWQAVNG